MEVPQIAEVDRLIVQLCAIRALEGIATKPITATVTPNNAQHDINPKFTELKIKSSNSLSCKI